MLLMLVAFLAAALVIGARGYGDDIDSYAMLQTWQTMLLDGVYQPSRFQGDIVPEFVIGFLASQFGPYGSNLMSLLLSLAAAVMCWRIFSQLTPDGRLAGAAVLTVVMNPFWIVCSATSVDYMYAITFSLLGIWLLIARWPGIGALAFAVATGSRISYAPLGMAAMIVAWVREQDRREKMTMLSAAIVYLVTGGLFYLPVLIASHLTFRFLTAARPIWQGFIGLAARFVYKAQGLYGMLGTSVVIAALAYYRDRRRRAGMRFTQEQALAAACAWFVILFHLGLFLWIPVRVSYLLPVLIAAAAMFVLYQVDYRILLGICVLEIGLWFVRIDPLKIRHESQAPCAAVKAIGAEFSPHLARGRLLPLFEGDMPWAACGRAFLRIAPKTPVSPLPPPLFGRQPRPTLRWRATRTTTVRLKAGR